MANKDYLEAFAEAARNYGDALKLQTPSEVGAYTAEVSGGGVYIKVESPYLAATLYAFMDALELMEDQGLPPVETTSLPRRRPSMPNTRKQPRISHRISHGKWVRVERGDDGVIYVVFPDMVWPGREESA